jgi:hypothetical protein
VALLGLSLALNIPDKIPIGITLPSKNRYKKSTYLATDASQIGFYLILVI